MSIKQAIKNGIVELGKFFKIPQIFGFLVGYLIISLIAATVGLIGIIVLGVKNGDDPPSGSSSCYSSRDFGWPRFLVSAKGADVAGKYPKSANDPQKTYWQFSGLYTNGEPMEVIVSGFWHPWGIKNTDRILTLVQYTDATEEYNKKATLTQNSPVNCISSISIDGITDPTDQNLMSSTLDRYGRKGQRTPIYEQMSYLKKLHCLDTACKYINNEIDNPYIPTCSINNGSGVYMKIGSSNYAYHVTNNKAVMLNEKGSPYKSTSGQIFTVDIPFTLPMQDYLKSSEPSGLSLSHMTPYKTPYITSKTDSDYIEIVGDPNSCPKSIDELNPDTVYDQCPLVAGQKIYLAIIDSYYEDNTGSVDVVFRKGADPENLTSDRSIAERGFLGKLGKFFFSIWYGPSSLTSIGPHIISGDKYDNQGLLIILRNTMMQSATFQTFKFIILSLYLVIFFVNILVGKKSFDGKSIVSSMIKLYFGIWGTDPENYELFDRLILPMYFDFFLYLAGIMSQVGAQVSGLSIATSNPLASCDEIIAQIWNDVLAYKMLAAFIKSPSFFLSAPLIIVGLTIITIHIFRTGIVFLMTMLRMGMLIVFFPATMMMYMFPETSHYAAKIKSYMILDGIYFTTLFFILAFFVSIAYGAFVNLMAFEICWDVLFTFQILFIRMKIHGWKVRSGASVLNDDQWYANLIIFMFSIFIMHSSLSNVDQFVKMFGKPGFGTEGGFKGGLARMDKLIGKTTKFAESALQNTVGLIPFSNKVLNPLSSAIKLSSSAISRPEIIPKTLFQEVGNAASSAMGQRVSSLLNKPKTQKKQPAKDTKDAKASEAKKKDDVKRDQPVKSDSQYDVDRALNTLDSQSKLSPQNEKAVESLDRESMSDLHSIVSNAQQALENESLERTFIDRISKPSKADIARESLRQMKSSGRWSRPDISDTERSSAELRQMKSSGRWSRPDISDTERSSAEQMSENNPLKVDGAFNEMDDPLSFDEPSALQNLSSAFVDLDMTPEEQESTINEAEQRLVDAQKAKQEELYKKIKNNVDELQSSINFVQNNFTEGTATFTSSSKDLISQISKVQDAANKAGLKIDLVPSDNSGMKEIESAGSQAKLVKLLVDQKAMRERNK